jgi:hypothetical protein
MLPLAITDGLNWAAYAGAVAISAAVLLVADRVVKSAASPDSPARSRGVAGLVIGVDGRTSTSKLNAFLWTLALAIAFVALILEGELSAVGDNLQEEYLLLLGGPYAAAIGAKAITTTKVNQGELEKTKAEGGGAGDRLAEVVADDEGSIDLGDFQYFFFTAVALVFFWVDFVGSPAEGLPEMPGTLVGLTSASALAYLAKKEVYTEKAAEIFSASPSRIVLGQTKEVRISGSDFVRGGDAATESNSVLLDGVTLESSEWSAGTVLAILDGSKEDLRDLGMRENQQAELIVTDDRGRPSEPFKVRVEDPD